MQRIATLVIVLLLSLTLGVHAESQYQLTRNAATEYEKADKELTALYKQLLDSLDKNGKAALITSQQAWVKYRDANSMFLCHQHKGGSIYAMAYTDAMRRHTRERIDELKAFMQERAGQ